jgi:hypothetical protein
MLDFSRRLVRPNQRASIRVAAVSEPSNGLAASIFVEIQQLVRNFKRSERRCQFKLQRPRKSRLAAAFKKSTSVRLG